MIYVKANAEYFMYICNRNGSNENKIVKKRKNWYS